MKLYLENNNSYNLILFFCGWGMDETPFFVMKNSVFLQAKNLEHDLADSERNAKSCISGKKEGLFLWNKCFYQQR